MVALVTGAGGQLGTELLRSAPSQLEVLGLTHDECDIANTAQVDSALAEHRPDLVINAAAYTAVDDAEHAPEIAHAVNAGGAANVARAAVRHGARVIQISTDYVFDGASRKPYLPSSRPNPINTYGASKLAGEREVQVSSPNSLVIRSSWLYASHGKNFLRTILTGLGASRQLRVVNDQIGVPTSARSLAGTIWACAKRTDLQGIHHWTDGGAATWFDFAAAIQEIALESGILSGPARITGVTSDKYQLAARRPRYSILNCDSLSRALGRPQRPWRTCLAEVISELSQLDTAVGRTSWSERKR